MTRDPAMDDSSDLPSDEEGPVGIFPGWGWVYGTVIVYGVVVIGILTLLTRILDFGRSP